MTDDDLIKDLDRKIARFQGFVRAACQSPLPPYNFDRRVNLHPWIRWLYWADADIWEVIVEQVRPALLQQGRTGTADAELQARHDLLLRLSDRLQGVIDWCRRGAP